jgi:hypothetical protein
MKRNGNSVMLSLLTLLGFMGATAGAQSPGSVFAIANTANEEIAISAAFDGSNYLVGIQGDATAHYNITAQLVSPAGTLVGPRISPGRTGGVPWVAFDGTNYLMVWSDDAVSHPDDPIYGLFVSPSGGLVGSPFAIASGPSDHGPQGVAFDGTNYLVIYSDAESSPFHLCGRFVSPSGTVGDEFVLASNAAGAFQAVAWNGSTYLVAWPAHLGGSQNIVQGRTVSKTGVMSNLITIDGTISVDQNPLSVATDGTNFLVVWNYDASVDQQGDAIWELRGRVITSAGGFVGSQFTVADTSTRPFFPCVAFDGASYLVAWTAQHDADDLDVVGRYFSPVGTPLGAAFDIAGGDGNQGVSPVVFGDGKYLVVWNDGFAFESGGGTTSGDVLGAFLDPPLVITAQPEPQTVTAGGTATFTLAANGTPAPGYKWQVSTDGGFAWTDLTNTAPYSGVGTATLTITGATTALSRYQFRCMVSNSSGSVNSAAALLRVAPVATDFSGSDDFSTAAHWSAPTMPSGRGGLTFANNRLEYTVNSPSGDDGILREWTANVGSYTQDWSVQVDVHLASLSLSDGQHANLNLVVVNAAEATNSIWQMDRMIVAIDRYGNGATTVHNFEGNLVAYYADTAHDTGLLEVPDSATDAALRISFNSATKELTSRYDADGATGGYHWTLLQTLNIGSDTYYTWDMTDSSTFAVALAGGSGGVALSSGQAYFDNFQATTDAAVLHDWNGDGIVSIVGDVPPFVNCVYFQNCPDWPEARRLAVGDCNHDGLISIVGDVPCFVDCVYFQNCP